MTTYVLIDFRDDEMREIVGVVGPFASEEQRWGEHLILPLREPD